MSNLLCFTLVLALSVGASVPSIAMQEHRPPHRTIIRGVVRSFGNHAPLEHVVVTLERESGGFIAQAETDGLGKFTFDAPGEAVFVVRVRPTGYEERVQRVDLQTNSSDFVTFELSPTKGRDDSGGAPGPGANLSVKTAMIPEKARQEFTKGRELFIDHKDADSAIKHLQKAIKIYDKYTDAYVLVAMAYMEVGKVSDAQSTLEKAVSQDATSAEANIALGMLLNHEKNFVAAEKSLSRGLELNPNAPQGHYELAKTYWALGRWQEAEPHVQRAIELKPDMAPAHVLLGNVALRKGDNQRALAEFKEYLRLEPTGPMAVGAGQMVNKLEQQGGTPH